MEQIGVALDFFAFYTASKLGKTGLTVTCTVRDRTGSAVVTAQAATELAGGLYRYTLTSGNNTAEGEYIAVFTTTDTTVDQRDIPALWAVQKGGIENLDAAVSSRNAIAPDNASLTTLTGRLTATRAGLLDNLSRLSIDVNTLLTAAGYTAPDNATIATLASRLSAARAALLDNLSRLDVVVSALTDLVWNEQTSDHTVTGTMGEAVGNAGSASDPLLNPVPGTYPSGSAGYTLGRLASTTITVTSPMSSDGTVITLQQGDDYLAADGRALSWTSASWPDLTGADVLLMSRTEMEYVCAAAGHTVTLELTAEVTRGLGGRYPFDLVATLASGHVVTLTKGVLLVERSAVQ